MKRRATKKAGVRVRHDLRQFFRRNFDRHDRWEMAAIYYPNDRHGYDAYVLRCLAWGSVQSSEEPKP